MMRGIAGRIQRMWKQRGSWATVLFLLSRIFRHRVHLVFETTCATQPGSVQWEANEQLLQFGPENLDEAFTPELLAFLGGDGASESLQGVRDGDRLFVIK